MNHEMWCNGQSKVWESELNLFYFIYPDCQKRCFKHWISILCMPRVSYYDNKVMCHLLMTAEVVYILNNILRSCLLITASVVMVVCPPRLLYMVIHVEKESYGPCWWQLPSPGVGVCWLPVHVRQCLCLLFGLVCAAHCRRLSVFSPALPALGMQSLLAVFRHDVSVHTSATVLRCVAGDSVFSPLSLLWC